jgi:hypothetical protein
MPDATISKIEKEGQFRARKVCMTVDKFNV